MHKNKILTRLLSFVLAAVVMFTMLNISAWAYESDEGDYIYERTDEPGEPGESAFYPGDLDVVDSIIDRELSEDLVSWGLRGDYLRVVDLRLEQMGLSGHLDLTGLGYLESLDVSGNDLSGLDIYGLAYLGFVDARFNRFESLLDIGGFEFIGQDSLLYYPQQWWGLEDETENEAEAEAEAGADEALPGQPSGDFGNGIDDENGVLPDVPVLPEPEPGLEPEPEPEPEFEPELLPEFEPELEPEFEPDPEPVLPLRLPAPAGLSIDAYGVLTWGAVANVRAYDVYVNGLVVGRVDQQVVSWINILVEVTRFDLGGVDYGALVQVRAIGDGVNFGDSGLSAGFVYGVGVVAAAAAYAGVVPAAGVDITGAFTCAQFLSYVRGRVGRPAPQRIYSDDVESITTINMWGSEWLITTLDGIEYFTALTELRVRGQLTSLDVSGNTALTTLYVRNSQLTNLDVYNNTALTELNVSGNRLTSLDVSNNIVLTSLSVTGNQLSSMDLSNNIALTELNVGINRLTSLNISNNTALASLDVHRNQLTSLDVYNNTSLTVLSVGSNQLISLDVSNNILLTSLSVIGNQLSNLDVSNNAALTSLNVGSNQLTSLNVSNNTALASLDVSINRLNSLDVSSNTALTSLNVRDNLLTDLDVYNNTALTSLWVWNNNLDSLDVSNNAALTWLDVGINRLNSLDVSNNIALTQLNAYTNRLTNLDVSNNTALNSLSVFNNRLTSLDVSYNIALASLRTHNNFMTEPNDVIGWEYIGLILRPEGATTGGNFIFWPQGTPPSPSPSPLYSPSPSPSPEPSPSPSPEPSPSPTPGAALFYPGDIAVINNIIQNNGLNLPLGLTDGSVEPDGWGVFHGILQPLGGLRD